MKVFLSLICAFLLTTNMFSQQISYHLSMPHPESHYFDVEMELSGFSSDTLELKMPVWAPGSYLVREFPSNVNRVTAMDYTNVAISVNKIDKNTWQIIGHNSTKIKVNYQVYAFELSVRTSFIDLTHAYLNGTSVFMYVKGAKELPGKLEVTPYKDFKKVSTALPVALESVVSDGSYFFQFENYDQLVDCPFEIGNHEEFDFNAAGVHHRVAMFGQGNYDIAQLKVDMAKIVEEETKVFGVNPNKEYLFIIHNVTNGGGGLEHKSSTTLGVNRDTYDKEHYNDFLNVMAHEYFHLWNVKRLRPYALGPFDYDHENYTTLLWFSEGFTSYYADVFLRRAGFYTEDVFTHKVISGINYIERMIGNKVQPVADASFDAWIKSYRPNENSSNSTVSYYSKGRILGAVFDAMIIAKYNGEKNLDDFMRMMYELYAVKLNRGFTDKELESEFSKFMEEDMSNFFQQYIYETKTIDYGKYFDAIGFDVENNGKPTPYFGISVQDITGGLWIKTVNAGSPAEAIGLSPNDAIIQVNGALMDLKAWNEFMKGLRKGKTFELAFVRDGILMNAAATMGEITLPVYEGKVSKDKEKLKLYDVWTKTSVN